MKMLTDNRQIHVHAYTISSPMSLIISGELKTKVSQFFISNAFMKF